jgi:hypothetical protein
MSSLFHIIKRTLFIKNANLNTCKNCVYFIKDTPFEYGAPNDEKYGKCKMFGEKNLITGIVQHDYAVWCRQNNAKCGQDGKYFKEK